MSAESRIKGLTISHYTALYGANNSLLNLLDGTKSDIDWTVICRTDETNHNNPFAQRLRELKVKYVLLPFSTDVRISGSEGVKSTKLYFLKELFENIYYAFKLRKICKGEKIRFIHSNSSSFCFGAYVSFISGIPHYWHFREFLDLDYNLKYHFGTKYLSYWAGKANLIISISKAIEDLCVKQRDISTPSVVLYNGIIFEKNLPKLMEKRISAKCRLLIIGVIAEVKNQLEALMALKLLLISGVNVELWIAGEKKGDYYRSLCHFIELNGLENDVVFLGFVSKPEDLYNKVDITLMCSRNEGMGRVTVESQAYGVPVIGFDNAGTSELIADFHNGLLYRGGEEELADTIKKLINSPQLYNDIRLAAQSDVRQKFTIENSAKNFLNTIK